MAIHKISDFDPDYRNSLDDRVKDIKGLDLYVNDDKVGSVDDILVDDNGAIRYLIIHTGNWIMGKKVLLPIGFARIDYSKDRVYAKNLTKSQVESLPEFKNEMVVDYDHEERVRGVYGRGNSATAQDVTSGAMATGSMGGMAVPNTAVMGDPDDMLPVETGYVEVEPGYASNMRSSAASNMDTTPATPMDTTTNRDAYDYDREPHLYGIGDEEDRADLKLYAERLVASKTRRQAGEAVIRKRVETETAQASIPVTKERIEIERTPATGATSVAPGDTAFQEGVVSRVEIYEEVPEFRKEAYVSEEVKVNKVVETETATTSERVRREEVDIDVDNRPPASDVTGS
jgi:uncharacterized protein (TIGR02271 family)